MPLFRRKQKDGVDPKYGLIGGPRLQPGRGNPLVEAPPAPAVAKTPAAPAPEAAALAPVKPARLTPAAVQPAQGVAPVAPLGAVAETIATSNAAPPPDSTAPVVSVQTPPAEGVAPAAAAPAAAPSPAKPTSPAPVAKPTAPEPLTAAAVVPAQFVEETPAATPAPQPTPIADADAPTSAADRDAPAPTEPPPPVAPVMNGAQAAAVAPALVAPQFVAAESIAAARAAPPVAPPDAVPSAPVPAPARTPEPSPAPETAEAPSTADHALARRGISAAAKRNGNGHELTPVVSVQNITKIYQMGDVEVAALRGINVEIYPGEMTAIMGPSGSGKSTLMNVIGCLDVPTDGAYLLDGIDVSRLSDDQLADIRARKIGFVFQSFNLLSRTTALANVELPLIYAGAGGRARHHRAEEALRLVGLGDRVHHKPNELSGGQQQRVAIARALINDPAMILADEPTGNLDTKTSVEIMELFQRLNVERGMTILFVTHNIETADYCHRVIHVRDGVVERDVRHEPRAGIYRDLLPENMALEDLRPSIGDEEVSI